MQAGLSVNFADLLVIIAGFLQALGFVIIDQIRLRILVLLSTALYLTYYLIVADTPLWGAFVASSAIGVANLFGLFQLLTRDSLWRITPNNRPLLAHFPSIPPGEVRRLLDLASRRNVQHPQNLTIEGKTSPRLFLLISGGCIVEKSGTRFDIMAPCFVGEVAYLTNDPASATVIAQPGAHVLEWNIDSLSQVGRRHQRLKLALDAMISNDLAHKVKRSVAQTSPPDQPPAEPKLHLRTTP